jgi:protein-disulfide isomerase
MNFARRLPRLALCAALLALACNRSGGTAAPAKPGAPPELSESEPAGTIAGKALTVGELDAWIKDQLFKQATRDRNPTRTYELRNRALEQMASERALDAEAAKAGKDRDTLLKDEVDKRAAVTDDDVQKFYDAHKDRFGSRSFEQVSGMIRSQLKGQKQQQALQEYVEGLRKAAGFESKLEAPRYQVAGEGISLGPANAPITVVEFSDYECPFCKRIEPTVQQLMQRYPTQVRLVYRDFPLENVHQKARGAAEAARCAGEQGKYWEMHNLLFEKSPALTPEDLKGYAKQLGLDEAKYDECVAQRRSQAAVEADLKAGQGAGVSGTPAFFIDGLPITNVRSLDELAKIIDDELAKKGLPVPPKQEPPVAQTLPPPGSPPAAAVPGVPPAAAPAAPGAPPAPGPTAPPAAAPAAAPSAAAPSPAPPAPAPAKPPAAAQ